ncbi:hypothetical protein GNI_140050 [Gregarina niphandrodes]|uniref:Uncharacterized protein n=1 Tax=Gregarina niphandrodes TaxID=110365 RepID=A0A023B0D2_GRENI|nr:hypothetical protein GNI_140050 [Gregarina niphandrodes]EZG45211.1 hypothetical protein GNI_140050 [Gregarina niphandrodes]|eukprot:XP_011132538.1 hypothetical protein GNI_140050 [Gregarina niphandrodes]
MSPTVCPAAATDRQPPTAPVTWPSESGLPSSGLPPSGMPPSGLPPSGLPPSRLPPSGLPPVVSRPPAGREVGRDRYWLPDQGQPRSGHEHRLHDLHLHDQTGHASTSTGVRKPVTGVGKDAKLSWDQNSRLSSMVKRLRGSRRHGTEDDEDWWEDDAEEEPLALFTRSVRAPPGVINVYLESSPISADIIKSLPAYTEEVEEESDKQSMIRARGMLWMP